MIDLYLLLVFMIVAAIVAVEAKDLLSSIVALGAVGLGLCITFIVLKAPDVAITQLVVETLALIILIRATLKTDIPFSVSGRWFLNTVIYVLFIAVLVAVGLRCFQDLPRFGEPIMRVAETYLKEGLQKTGAANIVSAVVLDYRTLDTLCEATILFTAVVAVLAMVRRTSHKQKGEESLEDE